MAPFVQWLVAHHGKADTPTGDLARVFASSLADSDDRAELRTSVEYFVGPESWALDAFDAVWDEYKTPTCRTPGCTAKAAGGGSSFCPLHGGRRHHAAGRS